VEHLEGKVAFVTGGASGIGLGITRALVDAGMKVMIADLRADHIASALELFESLQKGRQVAAVELDVSDRDAFARAADVAWARFGAVHVLVNNAGVGIQGSVVDATFADWDWGLGVNLGGAINGITTFLPRMIAQGQGGHIINTSSQSGLTPPPRGAVIYGTTKAALVTMTETIREELAEHDIGVSVLIAGFYRTNIREAGQNRPAKFRTGSGYAEQEARLAKREDAADWADPLDAGERVVKAIRENQLYVVTHGEFRGWVEQRFEDILAAIPPADPALVARMGRRRPPRPG
jgi:NAD(P)-dependent dehydrogenase (short-subunit alcohol dehydrogenase family)